MKCPKCDYLGFETGDRCKNCGYDFSLSDAAPADAEVAIREPNPFAAADEWLKQVDRLDASLTPSSLPSLTPDPLAAMPLDTIALPVAPVHETVAPARAAVVPARTTPALPLFQPGAVDDDEPLIKLPATPRAPLAVRRTPEKPRLRAVPKAMPKPDVEPVLAFNDEAPVPSVEAEQRPRARGREASASLATATSGRRIAAAALDHLLLAGIDVVVIYFTLKIAAVPLSEWRVVPIVPLAGFLALVKFAYFSVFTLVGGQTIGKMAAGIYVVSADGGALDTGRVVRRTLIGALSVATAGLAYLPAVLTVDRRAIHDRLTRTRVVGPVGLVHQ